MYNLRKTSRAITLIIVVAVIPQLAFTQVADSTQSSADSWDRFSVSFGGFLSSYNSGILFASKQIGVGINVDIEDALGLNSTTLAFRGKANYNFGKKSRHSAIIGYFGIIRNSTKILDEELALGNIIYPVGTEIKSKFDLTIVRVKYGYSFFQDDRISLGATFGLFIMPVNLTVKALSQSENKTEFTAPLPLLGLRTDFAITRKLFLRQNVEVLYLSIGSFTGSVLDLNVMLEHKTFDHIAFGAGVNSNRIHISIEKPDSSIGFFGDIKMDYTGLLFYGKYYF